MFHSTGDQSDTPGRYVISATAFPSFNTYYEITGLDFGDLSDSEDRHYFNIEFADGTLLYPDRTLDKGSTTTTETQLPGLRRM